MIGTARQENLLLMQRIHTGRERILDLLHQIDPPVN